MAKTRHIQKRMSQRGIKANFLEIVKTFGSIDGEKCVLNRKACTDVLNHLDAMRKDVIHMQEKGGFVLVEDGGAEITSYRINSFKK